MRKPKQKKLYSTSRAQPANASPCDIGVRTIQKIYSRFQKISDGADGGVSGINGSIRPKSLARVLRALSVKGNELVDFGAGAGRVLLAAVAEGASRSYGYELPENKGMKYVFDSMVISATLAQDRVEWIGKDISVLNELNGRPSCAFSFWVGFPLPVQEHILQLCSETRSIQTIAVFKDAKWGHSDQGEFFSRYFMHCYSESFFFVHVLYEIIVLFAVLHALERATRAREGPPWFLSEQIPTSMHGSGQQHQAWIFSRLQKPDHPC